MPLEEYSASYPYGGVQFGYSASLVRLFYPVGPHGCLVRIGPQMGGGIHQQCARRATLKLDVWGRKLGVTQGERYIYHGGW